MSLFGKERKIIREIPEFEPEPEPVETFTSPDDERSITILINNKDKITGAVLSERYDLSARFLSRFYILMKQARYVKHYRRIAFEPIRIGYELFTVFNMYNNRVYVINDRLENDRFINFNDKLITLEELFELKETKEDIHDIGLDLLDRFNTNTVITYPIIQRELVVFFLDNIFKKYSLY